MVDYRYLPAFFAVATHSSFTEAGKVLHIATSAVSRQIQLLEDSCGTQLFLRLDRKVLLTDAGQKLFAEMKHFQVGVEGALNSDSPAQLNVGSLEGIVETWLAPILAMPSLADINIDLKIAHPNELIRAIEIGEIDLTFFSTVHKTKIPASMQVYRVFKEEIVLISKARLSLEDIDKHRLICYTKKTYIIQFLKKAPKRYAIVGNMNAIVELVRSGAGIAMVPSHVIKDQRGLNIFPVTRFAREYIYLIVRKTERQTQAVSRFIEAVKGKSPGWKAL